jgi:hypothetical protein
MINDQYSDYRGRFLSFAVCERWLLLCPKQATEQNCAFSVYRDMLVSSHLFLPGWVNCGVDALFPISFCPPADEIWRF